MERLLEAGALDVFYTHIQMKKNRPAFKLTAICKAQDVDTIKKIIFKETTTIGIRMYKVQRECMDREIKSVETHYGTVRVKYSKLGDITKAIPEYEDCKSLAIKNNVSLNEVYRCINK